ncbi:MAG: thioesterase family protein [Coxiellaceae bacterium]|nr:thioesterase family protein [Coxiellaceae bacterium]
MQAEKFTYSFVVEKKHLDSFGHVNNAMYLTLFEDARWDLITKNGYGLAKIHETQIGPTILEICIRFVKELLLGEQITIESQVTMLKSKIGIMTQKMSRDGELCCEAEFTIGLFDLKARKLVSSTPEWLKAIGASL